MPRVSVGELTLHVETAGVGPPLLLVHGFPLDHTMWSAQIAHCAATHRVIAPDLRGFGRSDVTDGVVTMEQFADDLAALLTNLGVAEPVHLCGLSMGGYIAFAFLRRHRRRLRSLILCDTRAAADSPEAAEQRQLTAERVLKEGTAFLAEGMLERLFAAATRAEHPELVAATLGVMRAAPPRGVAAASRGMASRSAAGDDLLADIDVPTLVVVGSEDAISPAAEMQSFSGKIPKSHFVVLEEAGHLAPMEQPAQMNAVLDHFLRES